MIFTKNQLFHINSVNNYAPVAAISVMDMHAKKWLDDAELVAVLYEGE